MLKFLFRPLSLLFIALYIGFVFWLYDSMGTNLQGFPWGSIYIQNNNGKVSQLGEVSYHFNSAEGSYISYENFDHFKRGFDFEYPDGSTPLRIKFTDFKYNEFSRTLSAVCDFEATDFGYLNVYFDYYIYENLTEFWRGSGFQIDRESNQDSLPFYFRNGASLIIEARSNNPSDDMPTDIFIRFENEPYPYNEPSYETETISVTSEMRAYEIVIPELSYDTGFSSVLMYIKNKNTGLVIKDIVLKFQQDGENFTKELIFSEAFGESVLFEPYNYKDLKWEFKFKFAEDFSKIEGGYIDIHSEGYEPFRSAFGEDFFYSKSE